MKTKLTYVNLSNEELMNMGNVENQNVGLLSIASYLEDNGIETSYLAPSLEFTGNNRIESFLHSLLNVMKEFKPDFVGFRYLAEFGDEIADIEFLSEVTEAGF